MPLALWRRTACAAASKDKPDAWTRAQECLQSGEPYSGIVKAVNRGGVIIDCWGVQGAPLRGLYGLMLDIKVTVLLGKRMESWEFGHL
jgi:hypothetical protein